MTEHDHPLYGGCHCGDVRFSVTTRIPLPVVRCNCSICRMSGFLHLIVSRQAFSLEQGEESLQNYQFNTRVAKHLFCRRCGIKSFYVPRSHPDGISVNVSCLDEAGALPLQVVDFDGANWAENASKLSPLSD